MPPVGKKKHEAVIMVSGAMDLQMSFGSLNLNSVGLTRPQQENVRAGLQQLLQRCDSLGPAQARSDC